MHGAVGTSRAACHPVWGAGMLPGGADAPERSLSGGAEVIQVRTHLEDILD